MGSTGSRSIAGITKSGDAPFVAGVFRSQRRFQFHRKTWALLRHRKLESPSIDEARSLSLDEARSFLEIRRAAPHIKVDDSPPIFCAKNHGAPFLEPR